MAANDKQPEMIRLSDVEQNMIGEGGMRMFGVYIFAFLTSAGEEKYAWVPVDDPNLAQVLGMLQLVQHQMIHNPEGE